MADTPDDKVTVGFHCVSKDCQYIRSITRESKYREVVRNMRPPSRASPDVRLGSDDCLHLIAQNRHTDVTFVIYTRVIDLRGKNNLRAQEVVISLCARRIVMDDHTVGALKGKFSGSVKVKRKVPLLYGLSDYKANSRRMSEAKKVRLMRTYRCPHRTLPHKEVVILRFNAKSLCNRQY